MPITIVCERRLGDLICLSHPYARTVQDGYLTRFAVKYVDPELCQ